MAETASVGSGGRARSAGRRSGRFPRLGGATWSFALAWELAERRGTGAYLVVGGRPRMARSRWFAAQVPFLLRPEGVPA